MIGSIILMFNTDPHLALTMLPLLLITSAIIAVFSIKMGPLFLTMQQKLDKLNTVLQENIAGVRVVKAFVRARHEGGRFEQANEDFTERNIRVMQFMSTMGPMLNFALNIGIVIVIWSGRPAVHPAGEPVHRADRGLRQLPADHRGPVDEPGQPGEHLGGRHRLSRARQRGAGCRP